MEEKEQEKEKRERTSETGGGMPRKNNLIGAGKKEPDGKELKRITKKGGGGKGTEGKGGGFRGGGVMEK